MAGFFSTWKNLLTQDFGGRYLARILREVIREEPQVAKELSAILGFRWAPEMYDVCCEWSFPGRGRRRRADLAILSKHSGQPIALVEIKDEGDTPSDGQLSDYVRFADAAKIRFIYLTHGFADAKDRRMVEDNPRCTHMTFNQLHRVLRDINNPLIRLLTEFLEEEAPVFMTTLNEKAIRMLVANGCSLKFAAGAGKLSSRDRIMREVPNALAGILSNTAILADQLFTRGKDLFGTRPSVNFYFGQGHNRKALLKHVGKSEDDTYCTHRWSDDCPPIEGWLSASGSLKFRGLHETTYLNVFYCYEICARTANHDFSLDGYLGTHLEFWSSGLESCHSRRRIPVNKKGEFAMKEDKAFSYMATTAREAIGKALRQHRSKLDAKAIRVFEKLTSCLT